MQTEHCHLILQTNSNNDTIRTSTHRCNRTSHRCTIRATNNITQGKIVQNIVTSSSKTIPSTQTTTMQTEHQRIDASRIDARSEQTSILAYFIFKCHSFIMMQYTSMHDTNRASSSNGIPLIRITHRYAVQRKTSERPDRG